MAEQERVENNERARAAVEAAESAAALNAARQVDEERKQAYEEIVSARKLVEKQLAKRDGAALVFLHDFLAARAGAAGKDGQAYHAVGRATDELHHVVQTPADHVHHFAGLALRHSRDAVVGFQLAAFRGRAAGNDVHDGDVVVDRLQRGANALIGKAHGNVVFLAGTRGEIVRVRVGYDSLENKIDELSHSQSTFRRRM